MSQTTSHSATMVSITLPDSKRHYCKDSDYSVEFQTLSAKLASAIKAVLPKNLNCRLTATQKGGKIRIELAGIYHDPGWQDNSG